jgi:hypothetical protein
MNKRYRRGVIGLILIAFIALLAQDLLRHRGPTNLKGGFEEIAFVRNEQNKGGIVRIYAFRVTDTLGADYMGCGELLPHNDYGSVTTVYFFQSGTPAPSSLQLEPPHFDTLKFRPIAVYTKGKDGVGRVKKSGDRR